MRNLARAFLTNATNAEGSSLKSLSFFFSRSISSTKSCAVRLRTNRTQESLTCRVFFSGIGRGSAAGAGAGPGIAWAIKRGAALGMGAGSRGPRVVGMGLEIIAPLAVGRLVGAGDEEGCGAAGGGSGALAALVNWPSGSSQLAAALKISSVLVGSKGVGRDPAALSLYLL
jgi:hypothetical protein